MKKILLYSGYTIIGISVIMTLASIFYMIWADGIRIYYANGDYNYTSFTLPVWQILPTSLIGALCGSILIFLSYIGE